MSSNYNQPKANSVQKRLLIPLSFVLIILITGFSVALILNHQRGLNYLSRHIVKDVENTLEISTKRKARMLMALQDILLLNHDVFQPLSTLNRNQLIKIFKPSAQRLWQEFNITHFYFHTPDGVTLLRLHKLESYGDKVNRKTFREAQLTGKVSWGLEIGIFGTLTLRVVKPIFSKDVLVGYIELGQEIGELLELIHQRLKIELILTIHKKNLDRKNWEKGATMLGKTPQWDRFTEEVLVHSTLSLFPKELEPFLHSGGYHHNHGQLAKEISYDHRAWQLFSQPILDVHGMEVGDLYLLKDITDIKKNFYKIIFFMVNLAILLLTVLIVLFSRILKRTDQTIQKQHKKLVENDIRFKTFFNNTNDALFVYSLVDEVGHFLEVNEIASQRYGYSSEEFLQLSPLDIVKTTECKDDFPDMVVENLEKDSHITYTATHITKFGHEFPVELNINVIDMESDTPIVLSVARDITERLEAEKALRDSEDKYRKIVENSIAGFFMATPGGQYISANLAYAEILHYDSQQDLLESINDIAGQVYAVPEERARYLQLMEEQGRVNNFECKILCKDGAQKWISLNALAYCDDNGNVIRHEGVITDINDRRKKEQLQWARLRLIDYTTSHTICEILQKFLDEAEILTQSEIGFYHFVDDEQINISLGTWSTNTLNMCSLDNIGGQYPIADTGVWVDCFYKRKPVIHNDYEQVSQQKGLPEGHTPIIRQLLVPVLRDDKIVAILGVGNKKTRYRASDIDTVQQFADLAWEIVVRKKTEEALKESEEQYRSMMESLDDPTYICSSDFQVEYMNPSMVTETGYDATGETCYSAIHNRDSKCSWCSHAQVMKGEHQKVEIVSPKNNKTYYISSSPIFHTNGTISKLSVFRDVTEIRHMEARLLQGQKMEAIGTLAGGIAHDFNNILFPMIGFSEVLKNDLPEDSPLQDYVDNILSAALRSKDLVQQILAFSRQDNHDFQTTRPQPIIKEALKLLRSSIPSTISIASEIDEECGLIIGDPTQIHQIVMNLATNAYHAMEAGGGNLTVTFKQVKLSGDQALFKNLSAGQYACLTVSDTGVGIEKKILERIFEPYFTTKTTGKGTGLGLSVVQGITKSFNGDIHIKSTPGVGTDIYLYLPIIAKEKEGETVVDLHPIVGGNETILLVDDEEAIIKMEKLVIERLGYNVKAFTGSVEALNAFKKNPSSFDLVITDLTMPNMTGDQLASKLVAIRPDLPIVLCTGFSDGLSQTKREESGIKDVLMKPLVKSDIAYMIRSILDGN